MCGRSGAVPGSCSTAFATRVELAAKSGGVMLAAMSFLKRLFQKAPLQPVDQGGEHPISPKTVEDFDYYRDYARTLVRGGYDRRSAIIGTLAEMIAEDGVQGLQASDVVDVEIAALRREEAHWPALTDYDRLAAAMDAMEDKGIVARENFTCCGTCGVAEIGYDIEQFRAAGRKARGYAFFHQQDTEAAAGGHGLYFNYGHAGRDYSEAKSLAIGRDVADTLEKAGLKVEWNGSLSQRVGVKLDWKRRWEHG